MMQENKKNRHPSQGIEKIEMFPGVGPLGEGAYTHLQRFHKRIILPWNFFRVDSS